jgi:hypothetical protein
MRVSIAGVAGTEEREMLYCPALRAVTDSFWLTVLANAPEPVAVIVGLPIVVPCT